MKALARLARPGATLATYTSARVVRDALAAAGFAVDKSIGYGRKREMLTGRFAPRWPIRQILRRPASSGRNAMRSLSAPDSRDGDRRAPRVARLAPGHPGSPWGAAGGASGLSAGVIQPHLSRDDCILSRFTRAGFLYAHSRRRALDVAEPALTRPPCGVLQIADDARHEARMAEALAALAYPAAYAQLLSRDAASARAGRRVRAGGWWIPMGDWAEPAAVVRAELAAATHIEAPAPQTRFHREVATLRRLGERWHAIDGSGAEIAAAPVVVLANAYDAARLVDLTPAPLQRVAASSRFFRRPPPPRAQLFADEVMCYRRRRQGHHRRKLRSRRRRNCRRRDRTGTPAMPPTCIAPSGFFPDHRECSHASLRGEVGIRCVHGIACRWRDRWSTRSGARDRRHAERRPREGHASPAGTLLRHRSRVARSGLVGACRRVRREPARRRALAARSDACRCDRSGPVRRQAARRGTHGGLQTCVPRSPQYRHSRGL